MLFSISIYFNTPAHCDGRQTRLDEYESHTATMEREDTYERKYKT